jgi:hypothetical protein
VFILTCWLYTNDYEHRAGFGVRSVTVLALVAITESCSQYFLHSSYVEQFAKFFIGVGCGEMCANVLFQY